MGCCSGRDKVRNVSEEAKWDYVNLSDFRTKSCWTIASYVWLWILVFISIAVYVLDTFTAVNLIAYDKWSSSVESEVPFEITKWIFFATICFSWALLSYEWLRAIRVMRGHGVADSFMDPLAVVLQSIRPGSGQGWRRFLVFTELTKENKGITYLAFFVYFQFKGAIRIILAEGPRVGVNGYTLWKVMQLKLIPEGEHAPTDGRSKFQQFFANIEALADQNTQQALILSSMTFTLVIWVFSVICLALAGIFYLLFLWHYIPSTDGSLSRYCQRKVDTRLERIVAKKVQKALKKEEAKRVKEEQREAKKENRPAGPIKKPTMPNLDDLAETKSEYPSDRRDSGSTLPTHPTPSLNRTNTSTTTGSRQPTLPDLGDDYQRPGMPQRSATQSSGFSVGSNAPLLGDAGQMGYSEPGHASPAPTLPPLDTMNNYRQPSYNRAMTPGGSQPPFPPMSRPGTAQSQRPYGPPILNGGMRPPPSRSNTGFSSNHPDGRNSPGPRYPTPNSSNFSRRPVAQSPLSDPTWSPHEQNYPSNNGPPIEMSPVEISSRTPGPPSLGRRTPANDGFDFGVPASPPPSLTPGPPPSLMPGAGASGPTNAPPSLTPGPGMQSQPQPQRSYTPYSADRNGNNSPAPLSMTPGPMPSNNYPPSRVGAGSAPPQRSFTAPMAGPDGAGSYFPPQQRPPQGLRSASARPTNQRPQQQQQPWTGAPRGGEEGW